MALTASEQKEREQLRKELGSGISAAESAELEKLRQELNVSPSADTVVNEMPEGLKGRFIVKNFAGSPEAAIRFLQKENPDFEIKRAGDGEIIARRKGADTWGRLDPEGFDRGDLGDLAFDIPAGFAQGALTAAGGVAGASLGGLGAIPAAMGASGVSGAGIEAVRQGIGSMFGLEDNLSTGDITTAGLVGAAVPGVLGTGAATSQIAKRAAQLGMKADDVAATQRGALGRLWDGTTSTVGAGIGSFFSGEKPAVMRKAATMLSRLKQADTNPELRATPLRELAKDVPKKLNTERRTVGKTLEDLFMQTDEILAPGSTQPGLIVAGQAEQATRQGTIPKDAMMRPFQELVSELQEGFVDTPAQRADLERLASVLKNEFEGMPELLTAKQAMRQKKRFEKLAKSYGLNLGQSGTMQGSLNNVSPIDAATASAYYQAAKNIDDVVVNRLNQKSPGLGDEYLKNQEYYSVLKRTAKENQGKFRDANAVSNFLQRSSTNDVEAANLLDLKAITGVDLEDAAVTDAAFKVFSRPNTEIRSLGGSTSTSRTVPLSQAGGVAGYALGQRVGFSPFTLSSIGSTLGGKMASPAALRRYMELNQAARQAPMMTPLRGYQATPYILMNTMNDREL
jgi:hypothetical protein